MFFFLDKTTRIYRFRLLAEKNPFAVELKTKERNNGNNNKKKNKEKNIP